jgi:hypothetical protein
VSSVTPRRLALALRAAEAFSLVEVVVAVGIFAAGIVTVLALFVPVVQSVGASREAEAAAGAAGVLASRLRTLPVSTVAGYLKAPAQFQLDADRADYDPALDGSMFYGSLAGDKVGRGDDLVWNGQDREKYFELTLIRNDELSPAGNDAAAPWIAFNVRVRWPAFLPRADGGATPQRDPAHQPALLFSGSVRR